MAEPVRMDPLLNSSAPSESREHGAHVRGLHRLSLERAEEAVASVEPEVASPIEPALHDRERSRIKSHDPLSATLAVRDVDGAGVGIEVLREEVQQLLDAEPRPPAHHNEGPVADAGGGS